ANRAASEILRAPSEENLIGRSIYDYVPAEQRGAWRSVVTSALDAREPAQVVELTFRSGHEELLAEVRLSLVESEEPTLLVSIRDVRDRQKLLEERSALEMRLSQVEKMEALGTLAGGVAHDMNNMLTAVRMAASSLVEELPEDSPERDDAQAIMTACTRFSRLVENLLGFAKREPGTKRVARIGQVFQEVTSLVEGRIQRSQVQLRTELELPNLTVEADPARLAQSLMNLVLNALDELPAVPESRILIRARCASRSGDLVVPEEVEGDEFVCLSVEDNGPGMPPKVKARAFDPFFTTKPEGRGTGLGLAVVYRNARQFGGWVTIESGVGQGTRVDIFVPRASLRPRTDSINPALERRSAEPR
ncbi:MAG: ATP-binding protein, partial [Myxococcota bacterium]